jgi:hypothetical protein
MKMKSTITMFAGAAFFALPAFSQITVTESNLIKTGQTVVQGFDSKVYKLPAAGTNQTWNFSNLVADDKDTISFGAASWYPGHSNFPKATHGIKDGDSSFSFLTLNATKLSILGTYDVFNGEESADTGFGFQLLKLPATMGTKWTENKNGIGEKSELGIDPDGPGPFPVIDSIQTIISIARKCEIDAWGKLTIPLGTYDVIRANMEQIFLFDFRVKVSGAWVNPPKAIKELIFGPIEPDTSNQHFYWTNNSQIGFPLMDYDFSKGDDSVSDLTFVSQLPQFSNNTKIATTSVELYPNPAAEKIFVRAPGKFVVAILFDSNAKVQSTSNGLGMASFDIANLAPGSYTVQVTDNLGKSSTHKIIKN